MASSVSPARLRRRATDRRRASTCGSVSGRSRAGKGDMQNLAQVLVTLLGRQVVVLVAADGIEAKAG
jgi:hypothetical protein